MGNGNQNQKEDPNRLRVEFPNGAIASGTPTMLGRLINRVAETNPKEVGKTGSSASKGLWTSIPSTSGGSTKIETTSVATAATSKENTDGMVNRIQKGAINMAQSAQKGAFEMAQNAPKKASELKEKLRSKFFSKPWEKPEYQMARGNAAHLMTRLNRRSMTTSQNKEGKPCFLVPWKSNEERDYGFTISIYSLFGSKTS